MRENSSGEVVRLGGKNEDPEVWGGQTFRVAFVLACMSAVKAMAPGASYQVSHPNELLVGFVPTLLIGFLSVALPRWTKRAIVPRRSFEVLLTCHALAFLFGFFVPTAGLRLHALVAVVAVAVLIHHARVSRTTGAAYVTTLIGIHAIAAAMLAWVPDTRPEVTKLCISAVVLLCLEVGGRIAAALVRASFEREGLEPPRLIGPGLLLGHRFSAAVTVVLWSFGMPCSIPACIAGLLGLTRLILLKPWKIHPIAGVVAVLAGTACLNAGFIGLAITLLTGYSIPDVAIIHIWSVGGFGMIAVAVMTSVTRKRDKMPFQPAILASLAYTLIATAAVMRLVAFAAIESTQEILSAAKLSWVSAFLCCMLFVGVGSGGGLRGKAFKRSVKL